MYVYSKGDHEAMTQVDPPQRMGTLIDAAIINATLPIIEAYSLMQEAWKNTSLKEEHSVVLKPQDENEKF